MKSTHHLPNAESDNQYSSLRDVNKALSFFEIKRKRGYSGAKNLAKDKGEVNQDLENDSFEEMLPFDQQCEMEALLDYECIASQLEETKLPMPSIKAPSFFLPSENFYNLKEAFHSGAKIGTDSSLFYDISKRMKEVFKKLPFEKGGKIPSLANAARNEARQVYKNITRLIEKYEFALHDYSKTLEQRRLKAFEKLYLLELNHYNLHSILHNLDLYMRLMRHDSTSSMWNAPTSGKAPKGEARMSTKNRTMIKRLHATYHPEIASNYQPYSQIELTKLNHELTFQNEKHDHTKMRESDKEVEVARLHEVLLHTTGLIAQAKSSETLDKVETNLSKYDAWKEENWRRINLKFNRYKGAGCITGQAIQGSVTCIMNAGIAAAGSKLALAAVPIYAISTLGRVIETIIRTHFENELIKLAKDPLDDTTVLRPLQLDENASPEEKAQAMAIYEAIKAVHKHLDRLERAIEIHAFTESAANSSVNIAGMLTGMSLVSAKPMTLARPVDSLNAPVHKQTMSYSKRKHEAQLQKVKGFKK